MKNIVLTSVKINNFATFKNQEIFFDDNFNIIIGETGSGKSLVLDALKLIFGYRADKKVIRRDAKMAILEASLDVRDVLVEKYLEKIGFPIFDDSKTIHIKRIIDKSGVNKVYLNFQQCSLLIIKEFASNFLDFICQFDNQKLFLPTYQLSIVDNHLSIRDILLEYQSEYLKLGSLKKKLNSLLSENTNKNVRVEFLNHQISEIESLDISTEKECHLLKKKSLIISKKDSLHDLKKILFILNEGDNNIVNMVGNIKNIIESNVSTILENNQDIKEKIEEIILSLEDISYVLSKEVDSFSFSDQELEEVLTDLDKLNKLKRKYNSDVEGIISNLDDFKNELIHLKEIDRKIDVLEKDILFSEKICNELALKIHKKREIGAKILSKKISLAINKLKMESASFVIKVTKRSSLNSNGISDISFYFSPNKGEGEFLVKEVASGGELSRILLAIRQVLSSEENVSIFLFDEIDSGMGGETAVCIGKSLKKVSSKSQVITITHLPQVATFSTRLIVIKKITDEDRTCSIAEQIDEDQKNKQLKAMVPIGGIL